MNLPDFQYKIHWSSTNSTFSDLNSVLIEYSISKTICRYNICSSKISLSIYLKVFVVIIYFLKTWEQVRPEDQSSSGRSEEMNQILELEDPH